MKVLRNNEIWYEDEIIYLFLQDINYTSATVLPASIILYLLKTVFLWAYNIRHTSH
jgi:hypothetical protein